jgi:hypothetical protein
MRDNFPLSFLVEFHLDEFDEDTAWVYWRRDFEGIYAQFCTSIEDSCIRGRSGRAGGPDTGSGAESTSSALARSAQRQCIPT